MADAIDGKQYEIGAAEQFRQPAHIVLHAAVMVRQAAIMLFDIAPEVRHLLLQSADEEDHALPEIHSALHVITRRAGKDPSASGILRR
jgi:hypothetical protein